MRAGLLVALVITLAGCRTYDKKIGTVRENYAAGNFGAALTETQKKQQDSGGDALIWRLEHATILRAAGRIDDSVAAFEGAYELYMRNLDAAKIRLIRGGAELLTTPANAPYWGTGYDGIMLCTYQALNALQGGDVRGARVELVRAHILQQEAVSVNGDRIEKEQAEARKDANVSTAMDSGKGQISSGIELESEIQAELAAYANYVNPFTVYLDGLYHATQALDASDRENARRSMERASVFAPKNTIVKGDLERVAKEGEIASGVYVIFETGMAPRLEEKSFKLVLPLQHVPYIGLSYPTLTPNPHYVRHLVIRSSGRTVTTERVASMDAVIGCEFNNNFPGILAKHISSAITKAVATAVANETARRSRNIWIRLGTWVGTLFYQVATDTADTRSWQTLPKEFQVARLDVPPDRVIALVSPNGVGVRSVNLIDGEVVVVYAKSISQFQDMTVVQFKLR